MNYSKFWQLSNSILIMKKSLIACLLLLMAGSALAQATTDAQAKAIVDKAVAQLQRTPRRYTFTTTYTAGRTGDKQVQSGVCAINGKKTYVKFAGMETFFDGTTQWVFMPDNNEVSVSEPTPAEQRESNPLLMVRDYAQTHRVGFDEDTDAENFMVCLYPTIAKQVEYFRIKLSIDKKTYALRRIEFCQRNADRIVLTIDSQQPLPKEFQFVFDPKQHPDVEVNDLL